MNYNIMQQIQEISDFADIKNIMDCCKRQGRQIINQEWERIYKRKCPNHYLPLNDFIKEIDLTNWLNSSDYENIEDWVYKRPTNATINSIMNEAKERKLSIPKKVSEMICEACACNGCPYLEEHLGYDCNKCKKEMSYTGYEGYCDE